VCFCIINVNVGILLTFGKHLHERIISLRGEGVGPKELVKQPLFKAGRW